MGIDEIQRDNLAGSAQAAENVAYRKDLKKVADEIKQVENTDRALFRMMDKSSIERGMMVVSQAVADFAKSAIGKMFLSKDDLLKQLERKNPSALVQDDGDKVDLSDKSKVVNVKGVSAAQRQQQATRSVSEQYQKMDAEAKATLKEYSEVYARVITTHSEAASAQLEKLEQKLKNKGLTNNFLFELKLSIKNSVRGALVDQIKTAFLKQLVSSDMVVEWGTAGRGLNELLGSITNNEQVGGSDFGNYRSGLQGTVDHVQEEVSRELRVALKEIMDQKMTERLVSEKVKPEEVKKELGDYLKMATRVGFDTKEYLKTWGKSFIDEGLFAYNAPEKPTLLAPPPSGGGQQNNQGGNQPGSDGEIKIEQTEDYFVAALRAAYMSKALGLSWRASLRATYKIRTLKNKMARLGIYYEELNQKVQKEAQLVAGVKIMEMLNEALLERATLYRLQGPAYKMIDTKIVSLMKNATRMGLDISEYDFNTMRDNANRMVFDTAKRELHLTAVALSVKESLPMRDKKSKLVALLQRLKEESGITDDLGLSDNALSDRIKLAA